MKTAAIIVSLVSTLTAGVVGCGNSSAAEPAASTASADAQSKVERGKYLVHAGLCIDCHTPIVMTATGPAPDMTRMLSGHPADVVMPTPPALPEGPWIGVMGATGTAFAGPWGVTFTANLTPDPETGLGSWTAQTFIDTIRSGRHMGKGRPILPPMPAKLVANYTDEDLEAIFAYLQTLPPVKNEVPAPRPPQ